MKNQKKDEIIKIERLGAGLGYKGESFMSADVWIKQANGNVKKTQMFADMESIYKTNKTNVFESFIKNSMITKDYLKSESYEKYYEFKYADYTKNKIAMEYKFDIEKLKNNYLQKDGIEFRNKIPFLSRVEQKLWEMKPVIIKKIKEILRESSNLIFKIKPCIKIQEKQEIRDFLSRNVENPCADEISINNNKDMEIEKEHFKNIREKNNKKYKSKNNQVSINPDKLERELNKIKENKDKKLEKLNVIPKEKTLEMDYER